MGRREGRGKEGRGAARPLKYFGLEPPATVTGGSGRNRRGGGSGGDGGGGVVVRLSCDDDDDDDAGLLACVCATRPCPPASVPAYIHIEVRATHDVACVVRHTQWRI